MFELNRSPLAVDPVADAGRVRLQLRTALVMVRTSAPARASGIHNAFMAWVDAGLPTFESPAWLAVEAAMFKPWPVQGA